MMKSVNNETMRRLNEFKLAAQIVYTRFCQAIFFTGRFAEIIDVNDICNLYLEREV